MSDDDTYVVMNQVSGKGADSQWFDYRSGFYAPITRVEWELDTMHIVLPKATADFLVKKGYARSMTSQERQDYKLSSDPSVEPAKADTNKGD